MSVKNFLESFGSNFKKGLDFLIPIAATTGEVAVSVFAPALGPLFNQTLTAVVTAEQASVVAGKQKNGPAKLAAVTQLVGPLINQALIDAGKPNDDTAIKGYINGVVAVLNAMPTQTSTPLPAVAVTANWYDPVARKNIG